jgi:hypothetical protein
MIGSTGREYFMRDEIKKQMRILSQTAESVAGEFCFSKFFSGFQSQSLCSAVLKAI